MRSVMVLGSCQEGMLLDSGQQRVQLAVYPPSAIIMPYNLLVLGLVLLS